MISAQQFLAVLEEKDLLSKELLLNLHNQVAQSQQHITARDLAQVLIDSGYLTPTLAARLMETGPEQFSRNVTGPETERKQQGSEDIGFAPLKEEKEARPVIGRHRQYKTSDSSKNLGSTQPAAKSSKPAETPPPKSSILDQPPAQRWASSVYDRELDSSKGIVSPRLVKLAGVEEIPTTVLLRKPKRWMTLLIRGGIGLGLVVILYLIITLIFFSR